MRVSLDVLGRWCDGLPAGTRAARDLFDDLGLEVKRDEGGGVFTLELLANRGDHRCYLGLAREVCGRLGGQPKVPALPTLATGGAVQVRIETELCPLYAATPMEVLAAEGTLDDAAAAVLAAAGIHAISPTVDATNVVNMELGQPTHAFDADKIVGPITVRTARAGEKAWPLFTAGHVEVPEGALVIADDVKILAVAGVIGCEDSKVTAESRRIVLESACFDPVSVNITSRRLGIQTDASARFERGSDPEMVLAGSARVVQMLESRGLARPTGATTLAGPGLPAPAPVALSWAAASAFLGFPVDPADATRRLQSLGFGVAPAAGDPGAVTVTIPSHRRWEVRDRFDLYEEIARSTSYMAIPPTLPAVNLGSQPTRIEETRGRITDVLVGLGLYEVVSYGFYGRQAHDRLGLPEGHPLLAHVETTNSLDRGNSLLKNTGLVQALEGAAENQGFQVEEIRVFELTRTFHPGEGECRERPILWALAAGPERAPDWAHRPAPTDASFFVGVIEELATELSLPLRVVPGASEHALSSVLHPGRQAAVLLGDTAVGILGEVHPSVAKRFDLRRARPVYLELDLDPLLAAPPHRGEVATPPVRPPSVRNLAFTLQLGVPAAAVRDALVANGPEALTDVAMTDLYAHEVDGAPVRTITYALAYRNDDASLSVEQLNALTEGLVAAVEAAVPGATLRR